MRTKFTMLLLFVGVLAFAQDYQLSFTGSGESTTVDQVEVQNLTQGTTLTLSANEILNLVGVVTGIQNTGSEQVELKCYPNPSTGNSSIEFYNPNTENVAVQVLDITGKTVASSQMELSAGIHVFNLSGLNNGVYILNVHSSTMAFSKSIVSTQSFSSETRLEYANEKQGSISLKSAQNTLVQMQYNEGDMLLLQAYSGDYSRVLTLTPDKNETIDFNFVACVDKEENSYAVVTIGNQTWMAENLRYLPAMNTYDNKSDTAACYYVWGYSSTNVAYAKNKSKYKLYGTLYNWAAAMGGAASSSENPSGVQGVCPDGWHLPSAAEWTELTDYLGGASDAGGKLKTTGTDFWYSPNEAATNETGFSALPGGNFSIYGNYSNGGSGGMWWCATEGSAENKGKYVSMGAYVTSAKVSEYRKAEGYSVRCVKD